MEHIDPELLALSALGEPVDASIAAHLSSCSTCEREHERLRRVVAIGRSVDVEDHPLAPHSEVWRRIQAEIGGPTAGTPAPPVMPAPAPPEDAPVIPLPGPGGKRAGRAGILAAAAGFAGLIAGLAIAGLPALLGEDDDVANPPAVTPTPAVVARATLAPLPERTLGGSATVLQASDGRVLRLQLAGSVPGDGYREVWLLSPDARRLVSLGVLSGTDVEISLPAGLDLLAFPVVDVSQENFDGNPGHSADSLARGTLS